MFTAPASIQTQGNHRAAEPVGEPAGWTDQSIVPTRSTRGTGMAAGALDAWRGVAERGIGQGLSAVQQAVIAPFLASEFSLPLAQVTLDLAGVRIHVGGPAGLSGRTAVAMGRDIYVPAPQLVIDILGWNRRRWLVHELGHTMQWRALVKTDDGESPVPPTRRFLQRYVAGTPGAVVRGTASWLRGRTDKQVVLPGSNADAPGRLPSWSSDEPEPLGYDAQAIQLLARRRALSDHIHDAHSMEHQAEVVAQRFLQLSANPGNISPDSQHMHQ